MRNLLFISLLFCFINSFALQNLYTKHTVSQGETVYSISKQYGVSIEDIKKMNPGVDISKVKIGETLNIPLLEKGATSTSASTPAVKVNNTSTQKYHTVKSGESLYYIAKKYGVTLADLNKWNSISNNAIKIGQVLKVSETTATTNSTPIVKVAKPTNIDEDVTDPTTRMNTNKTTTTTEIKSTTINPTTTTKTTNVASEYKTITSSKISKGIGTSMLVDSDNENKNVMFSGAPIGTMVTVKNLMNGKTITAKVIGKIPSLDVNKDILVKLSSNAYKELGVESDKFLVEVSY
jgi:LysM repeat protein